MNILIVEDNPLMRALIRETVRGFAEIITECEDGDEAFAAYQINLPHWVLMDLQMPRVDGFTASRQIRAAYPNAQICMVTDYGDARTRRAAQEVGATAFVLKENLEELRTLQRKPGRVTNLTRRRSLSTALNFLTPEESKL